MSIILHKKYIKPKPLFQTFSLGRVKNSFHDLHDVEKSFHSRNLSNFVVTQPLPFASFTFFPTKPIVLSCFKKKRVVFMLEETGAFHA